MQATAYCRPAQSSVVLSLQHFLEMLCGTVNRTAVRQALMAGPQFPRVSLGEIDKVLRGWQFETVVFKAQPSALGQLNGPLLAGCTLGDGDKYFAVVRRVESGVVHYFSPFAGEVAEPLADFARHWQGLLLGVASGGQEAGRLWSTVDEETAAVQRYRRESVKLYDHFLPAELCRYVIGYAEAQSHFERSRVEAGAGGHFSASRTSSSITLKNRAEPVLQTVYQRVSDLLGVPGGNVETLQCVRYGEGQQFKPHFDANEHNYPLHTLLLYLNDDFEGGETFFPELNVKIKPVQGRLLHFINCEGSNRVLLQSVHAGLPVGRGTKYASNIWVHDNSLTRQQL